MGRQICFFCTQKDINRIVEQIECRKGVVLDASGTILNEDDLHSIADYDYCYRKFGSNKFYIAKRGLERLDFEEKHFNPLESNVIEFCLCTPSPKKTIDQSLFKSRFGRGGFIVVDDHEEYLRIMNKAKKDENLIDNPNYIVNGFEHGRLWYDSKCLSAYYASEELKEIGKLFDGICRFIRTRFVISKDRFAYIGTDALEQFKKGEFIPCSGKNRICVE